MLCCHMASQKVKLRSRCNLRVVDLRRCIARAVVVGMKATKEKRNRGPLLEEVDLVTAAKDSFLVELKLEVDRLVGLENHRVQRLVPLLASDQVQGSLVFARRLVLLLLVAPDHVHVEHADHLF